MKFHLFLWLSSLASVCLINFSNNVSAATSQCLSDQQSLLLHLKENLQFNPTKSQKLVHWNQSYDCCLWNGVTCNKGRVIALDLSEEFISGGLLDNSGSLFNLQYLEKLNLAYNDFHSEVPSELHKLHNLRYLNLSNAGFEGQIPIEISQLTKLSTLDLSTSFISLHSLKLVHPNITMLLQNLSEITILSLDSVRISAKGKEWCHALSSLPNLHILSMSGCNLSGPICTSLAKIHSLSIIRLNHNNMASQVPESFVNLSNLTTLELSSSSLVGVFPRNIFQMSQLQVLDASYNEDLQGSLPNFSHHVSLHTLNISHTNFSGLLPDSIHNLRQLSILDLSDCHFNGTLPNSISNLTQLVHLDLSFNNFTGPLPYFQMTKALKYLSISHNELRGAITSAHLQGLKKLVTIDLNDNSLNGSIPVSIFMLPCLRELALSYNAFEGQLDEIPNASSSKLEFLDLTGNHLQGLIPVSIFHLRRLNALMLSSNKFSGIIKLHMIRRLVNLTRLFLSHNNLSVDTSFSDDHELSPFPKVHCLSLSSCKLSAFPHFLRNLSNLFYLDLSNNQLQGTIPRWVWRFDFMAYLNLSNNFLTGLEGPLQNLSSNNLLYLDLHSNQLQGPIPIVPKNILFLDYSSNRFSSIVPQDIGNHLLSTYFLSLSNNSFHKKIHESFCNASMLRMLDLSLNSFNGQIPECFTKMSSNLRVLNLGRNKLSGHVSNTFSNSCALRYLDLSENLLAGTIPKSLANCQTLQVLNLRNNMFIDRFPCSLKSISTLRVIILRSNKFHGPVGCPVGIDSWGKLQIVDIASNHFSGTLPGTLFQSWKAMISDDDETRLEFGPLFFHISDDYLDPADLKASFLYINKGLALNNFAQLLAIESPFVIDHVIADIYAEDFGRHSYQDSVTIVNKGVQVKLVKILPAFTSLDFSSNHFEGPIPNELMDLTALYALNLSNNAFSGHIPFSLGHLKLLESLDLSKNSLSGKIPQELANLSFLSVLNLSYNFLEGEIPTGTQIQSFGADSFEGNEGLCGPPLTQNCSGGGVQGSVTEAADSDKNLIDWNFLSCELGFIFGFGIVVMPLILLKQWRQWYCKHVDDMLYRIVPQLDFAYEHHGGQMFRTLRWRPHRFCVCNMCAFLGFCGHYPLNRMN